VTSEEFRGQQVHHLLNECTIDDILDMNMILDANLDARRRIEKKAKKAKRHGTA
jgi:hypothetical protein